MKKALVFTFVCFVLSIVFIVSATVFALQSQPNTIQLVQISPNAAKQSQKLIKKLVSTAKRTGRQRLAINQQELSGLVALVHRAFPQVNVDIRLSDYGALLKASISTPLPDFIKYINLSAHVIPSPTGIIIEKVKLGRFSLSGDTFIRLTSFIGDRVLKPGLVDDILSMVKQVDINEQTASIHIELNESLLDRKNDKSLLRLLRDDLALFGDVKEISYYYHSLSLFAAQQSKTSSLAPFVRHVFQEAADRTIKLDASSAISQNQSALMSLIIYFGTDRFELLVGDIVNSEKEQLVVRNRMRSNVTLNGRNDLQKHFIYSMALQMFSSLGASDAIGEYKEFLDANSGGSGFSFADLMADRAGTRLAMIVTKDSLRAKESQRLLINVTDEQLLPSIAGLREGLKGSQFIELYQNVNSPQYKQSLLLIDNRLKTLPIYQIGW